MSIQRIKDPRIPNSIEKIKKIENKIIDYKRGRNRIEMIERMNGLPFKLQMFRVDVIIIGSNKSGGSKGNWRSYQHLSSWLEEDIRSINILERWSSYNRIYLDFSSGTLIVRFKEQGKRLFSRTQEEFQFENIQIKDEMIQMENDYMIITIGWTNRIPYILIERKINSDVSDYVLYKVKEVSDSDGIIDPENPDNQDDENDRLDDSVNEIPPIEQEHEQTMKEDNENQMIDLTPIPKPIRIPEIIDLTNDIDEYNPINEMNESDYASEEPEPEYDEHNFYENDSFEDDFIERDFFENDSRENRRMKSRPYTPTKTPEISRGNSPFSNRSPFNKLIDDMNFSCINPIRKLDNSETNSLNNQSNVLINQMNQQFNEPDLDLSASDSESELDLSDPGSSETNHPNQTVQPNQSNQMERMSESDNDNFEFN